MKRSAHSISPPVAAMLVAITLGVGAPMPAALAAAPPAPRPAQSAPKDESKAPDKDTPKETDRKPEEKASTPPPPAQPPSLDDLLNIPKPDRPDIRPEDDPGPVDPNAADPNRAELERALTANEVSEMFRQAIRQMNDAADRLLVAGDPGIVTQRIQDEILKKLDVLIEQAEQQSSSSSSSSSASQQDQQQQQAPPQQQQAQSQSENPQGENQDERLPPGQRSGQLNEILDAAKAAWGALPARFRDPLFDGLNDKHSAHYRRLTEDYYRRLAEDQPR